MTLFRTVLLVLVFAFAGRLAAADAPTAEEWTPVETALANNDADAGKKLEALVAAYPRWADGQRTLAEWRLDHGQAEQALADAMATLQIAPNDAGAAALAVQVMGKVGRTNEAFKLAERFVGNLDPQGWVNFRAAEVALEAKDYKKAELYLSLAKSHKQTPPAEFAFLDARISEASGDLDRAEVSLNRAIAAKPRFWTAIYQLGVINLRQAEEKTSSSRTEYLRKAEGNFKQVTEVQTKDALAWLGQGRAQLTLAQDLLVDDPDSGKAKAREAINCLGTATKLNDSLRDAHLNLGVALLIVDQPEEAITHLLRARELGDTSRTIGFNLMLAYQQTGRTDEFKAEAANTSAVSTAEKITAGIGFFKAGSHALAIELLQGSIEGLGDDRERIAAAYRFIGHAHAAIAASLTNPDELEKRNAELDLARDAWRKAGNLKDYQAQRFYAAQESARSPQHGYDAGWQLQEWHGYQSLQGWELIIGNYGGAVTGGQGIIGMWERKPVHVVVWGVLGFLPLLLGLIGLMRRKKNPDDDEPPVRRAPPPMAPRSPAQARKPGSGAVARKPGTGPVANKTNRSSSPRASNEQAPQTASQIPAAKSVPSPRKPTPRPQVRSPIETEPSMAPIADPREPKRHPPSSAAIRATDDHQRRDPETSAALERRKPRSDHNR